jgi:hypothetical protein
LEWGADLESADVYTILETYNVDLYERCRAAGYDLTQRHEMGFILGHGTSNRPLLGFVKRHRHEDPNLQLELNIALGYHARAGNEKGVSLCLWAGADPHAPTPNPELGMVEDENPDDEEDGFIGWSAIEEAASAGHLDILKRLGPDPERDDFDHLYRYAKFEFIVSFLPDDLAAERSDSNPLVARQIVRGSIPVGRPPRLQRHRSPSHLRRALVGGKRGAPQPDSTESPASRRLRAEAHSDLAEEAKDLCTGDLSGAHTDASDAGTACRCQVGEEAHP